MKKHPFFAGIDWEALERKEIPPPWKPCVHGETDTAYFNQKYTIAEIDEEPYVAVRMTCDVADEHVESTEFPRF